MIYYLLPGTGFYGGVKKAFQATDMLNQGKIAARLATPGASKPDWFDYFSEVIDRDQLPIICGADDIVMFSWPPDAEFVRALPARRKIVHMQGANTPGDEMLMEHQKEFAFISHGLHMSQRLLAHSIIAPQVPNSVSSIFRYNNEKKLTNSIAYMPRKGGDIIAQLQQNLPASVQWRPIENQTEQGVADILKTTDIYLTISPGEAFGLPPLEAMSSMCCVVGYPGDGGLEFMHHGQNTQLVNNGDIEGLYHALDYVLSRPEYRDALRWEGYRTAQRYTPERERKYLIRALKLIEDQRG